MLFAKRKEKHLLRSFHAGRSVVLMAHMKRPFFATRFFDKASFQGYRFGDRKLPVRRVMLPVEDLP